MAYNDDWDLMHPEDKRRILWERERQDERRRELRKEFPYTSNPEGVSRIYNALRAVSASAERDAESEKQRILGALSQCYSPIREMEQAIDELRKQVTDPKQYQLVLGLMYSLARLSGILKGNNVPEKSE